MIVRLVTGSISIRGGQRAINHDPASSEGLTIARHRCKLRSISSTHGGGERLRLRRQP